MFKIYYSKTDNTVHINDLKPGQIGQIVSTNGRGVREGAFVMKTYVDISKETMNLSEPDLSWHGSISSDIQVRILGPGEQITLKII